MKINEYLTNIRKEKALEDKEFSEIINKNIYWLEDFEGDEEEISGLSIPQLRNMCAVLEIDPVDIFDVVTSNLRNLNLSDTIRIRREEKYWTVDDLSERTGYEASVIQALEEGSDFSNVCIDALKKITVELDLSFDFILRKL